MVLIYRILFVPTVIRAMPLPPQDTLSPNGQCLLPLNMILPLSKVVEFHQKIGQYLERKKASLEMHGITQQPIFGSMVTNAFLYEPVLYWNDRPAEYHRRKSSSEVLSKASTADKPKTRKLLEVIRLDVIQRTHQCGGVHIQMGKMFPYMQGRVAESLALLNSIKDQLDPNCLMNPSALGFFQTNKH